MAETNVQLIPTVEPSKVQAVLGELETLKSNLAPLEAEAKALVVTNPEQYAIAGDLLKRVRDNRKQGGHVISPIKSIVKTITDFIRTEELKHSNKCEQIEGVIEPKMNGYKARERELALAEERRVNAERQRIAAEEAEKARKAIEAQAEADRKAREKEIAAAQKAGEVGKREAEKQRKAAEEEQRKQEAEAEMVANSIKASVQPVTVEPLTPKIGGLRQRQNWKFRIVDPDKVKRAFTCPDERQIGQFVRNLKNKQKAEELVGGIEVWMEDAV